MIVSLNNVKWFVSIVQWHSSHSKIPCVKEKFFQFRVFLGYAHLPADQVCTKIWSIDIGRCSMISSHCVHGGNRQIHTSILELEEQLSDPAPVGFSGSHFVVL